MWILVRSINAYDQEGVCFEAAWNNKPTAEDLTAAGINTQRIQHILAGGGRVGWEHTWLDLVEYKEGTHFDE